jgi:hypothetical protein
MIPREVQGAITFNSELSFGRVYSHWKSLGEKKEMVPLFEELREVVGRRKIYTPSLKRVLRGLGV